MTNRLGHCEPGEAIYVRSPLRFAGALARRAGGDEAIYNMKREKKYYVYIMTNKGNNVLYTGVTNNIFERVLQHKNKIAKGFTSKYNIHKLVYYEEFDSAYDAITREKQIKAGSRRKKIDLIESINKEWKDVGDGWYP
mgnify:CR=1 FL=1